MDIKEFERKAVESALFSAPVMGTDLDTFLKDKGNLIKSLAKSAIEEKVEHIYWVGAGNSRVNLLPGKELTDRFTNIPSDCYTSYEFIWRTPERLGNKSWVFLASYSGATEDTVEALRFANEKDAKTIVFVNKADSLMGKEADVALDFNSKALYILPMAGVFLFVMEIARLLGDSDAANLIRDVYKLPDFLAKQYAKEKDHCRQLADSFKEQELIYTLGCNTLAGIAYKFGLTVFMENMRVNGSYIETSEFRHGPAEMLDHHKPAFVLLMADDESREICERVKGLLEREEVPLIVFDAKDYPFHSLFASFVLMIPLQWFAVYSTYHRGIYDLDERALMGHGIMSQGKGVTWP
ncbi:MAG TPA: SIS domain-containing protein [Desulfobacteraceae bacterium]|nr:SIS domain-containing protein [Desulfobacteraceae bacterium]